MKKNTTPERKAEFFGDVLEDLVREKVQSFIQDVLEEELDQWLGRDRYERNGGPEVRKGRRNGHGKPRKLGLSCGTIEVSRPRVRDTDEEFRSLVLPLFVRSSNKIREQLPDLYLHGLSLGDFELALRGLLGRSAPLSKSSIDRLRGKWKTEYDSWRERDLSEHEIVYMWADGIYVKAGLEKQKAALLVVIGADVHGRKHLLAVEAGYRESTESWLGVFRNLKKRGIKDPKLLVMDGMAGAWAAAGQAWPTTKEQRCWNHKIINVLDRLPKTAQSEASPLLRAIWESESRSKADKARGRFCKRFEADYPKAVEVLKGDWERMVAFYDFPKEHWKHLRTTNVVESPFASARLRTGASKRFKKVRHATMMIWKTLTVAETNWRTLNAPELLQKVQEGATFKDGNPLVEAEA